VSALRRRHQAAADQSPARGPGAAAQEAHEEKPRNPGGVEGFDMKVLLVLLLLACAGCNCPNECAVLCQRITLWNSACGVVGESFEDCAKRYESAGRMVGRNSQYCWDTLVEWVLTTGSPKVDCTKPPPMRAEKEKR
jgi:hypothetical protein